MTVHLATVEFGHVAAGAESSGAAALGAEASYSFPSGLTAIADPEGGAGVVITLPLWGVELTSADLEFAAGAGMVAARTVEGSIQWINEKAAAQARLANAAGELALISRLRLTASKVVYPLPGVRISGAALADYGALAAGDSIYGRVTYRRIFGRSLSANVLGSLFLDTATDSLTDPTSWLRRQEASVIYGTSSVSISGAPVLAGGATYIANDPLGVVWVAPGDLGPGVNQIPLLKASNNPANYQQFPSVWLTNSASVNLLRLVELRTDAITADWGALVVMQVDRPPTHSRWQVNMNGQCFDVIVAHPAGSNLRTARAAFDAVWRPVVFGGSVNEGPKLYEQLVGGTFKACGVLNNTRLIRALRFIEPLDDTKNIASIVVQT